VSKGYDRWHYLIELNAQPYAQDRSSIARARPPSRPQRFDALGRPRFLRGRRARVRLAPSEEAKPVSPAGR